MKLGLELELLESKIRVIECECVCVFKLSEKWIFYNSYKMTFLLDVTFQPLLFVLWTRNDLEMICHFDECPWKLDTVSFKIWDYS